MFLGSSSLNLDAKGRLTVPSKHRDALFADGADKVVLTVNLHAKCLLLYTTATWDPIRDQLADLSSGNALQAKAKRFVLGLSEALELDGSGRLMVSIKLREYANLKKEVVMVGVGRNLEIWDAESWNEQQEDLADIDPEALSQELQGIKF